MAGTRAGTRRAGALLLAVGASLLVALTGRADAFVYWVDGEAGTIGRADNDGTDVNARFITGLNDPCGVAVNATHVYWGNSGTNSIGRANLNGTGVSKTFIPEGDTPCGPALSSTHV